MKVRLPMCLLLRRGLPLLAVLALLGPTTARAATPSPDVPPAGGGLHPDPAPTQVQVQAPQQRHVLAPRPVRPVAVAPTAPVAAPATTPKQVAPATPTRPRQVARHTAPKVTVADVEPLFVDVPVGLGDVAASLRDESSALLAAIALLAAAGAAASGIALTLVWSREAAL